ncbi:PE-PPE domain-containing protein [Mycolicibacterium mucogenicum]|uniref:PE-PPE domain-containing protein n=1 Tax=Mycolicibacterium mucogenicum TaxID=56689 RepID=UPI00226A05D0|nr:PE-PPE domain-containing protein [Mycolicibacterium mucogenicum]MCX8560063.1 PE-PPE domain-containing protein [Mycolicibacterium mucogenicum]
MAGKHREARRAATRRFSRGATAATVAAAGVATAFSTAATHVPVMSAPVALAALITPANSTAQFFAGSQYYNRDWSQYGQPQVVPFLAGPNGIANAVAANADDPRGIVVLSSGWGAGQTGTAIGILQNRNDPALDNVKLVVLDNNTNRAGGGFWTTYWFGAPFLLTSAAPTPSNTKVPIVDVAYEYNVNSDAPTYPINVLADANTLAAYLGDYGVERTAPVPDAALEPVAPGAQHYHYIVAPDGTVVDTVPVPGNITYVTFTSPGLPLLRPLRMIPGGNIIADPIEPALKVMVDAGYKDNSPIPQNPGETRPVGLFPSAAETQTALGKLPGAVQEGAQAAAGDAPAPLATTQSSPKTLAANTDGPQAKNPVDMTAGNKVAPHVGLPNPVGMASHAAGAVTSTVGGLVSGLLGGLPKVSAPSSSPAK